MSSEPRPSSLSSWWRGRNQGAQPVVLGRTPLIEWPTRRLGKVRVVVARSLCRLRWVRLNSVPSHERASALRLQSSAWQPFERNAYALLQQGEQGLIVAWDSAYAERAVADAGADLERCSFVPEPLVCETMDEGVRLLATADGYEAQAWSGAQLRASQWWPEQPAAQDWMNFLRANALPLPPTITVPEPETLAGYRSRPWGPVFGMEANEVARSSEQRLVKLGGLALALCLGLVGRQWWELSSQLNQRESELASLQGNTTQRNQVRERALNASAEARKWSYWLAAPLPIDVVEHLNATLPSAGGVIVKQLDLNGSKLRLGLQPAAGVQRADLVRSLQAGAWFKDVAEVRGDEGQGLVFVEMRIDGLRPIARATMAEAPAPNTQVPMPAAAPVAAAPVPRPAPTQPPATPIADFPPQSVFDAIGKK